MATGRNVQLTKMIGEYLVCAELCRRELLATTFTGNVPEFDILPTDKDLQTIPIQVKANAKGDWMLRADSFLNIDYDKEKKTQTIIGKKDFKNSRLIYILVKLVDQGKDEFYILRLQDLQRIIFKNHNEYLQKHGHVKKTAHNPEEDKNTVVYLPRLSFKLTDSQKKILEYLDAGTYSSIKKLSTTIELSTAMLYRALDELKDMDLVSTEEGIKLTHAGKIVRLQEK